MLRVFYDYGDPDDTVSGDEATPADPARIKQIARIVGDEPGRFLGLIDEAGDTLQFIREDDGFTVDVPLPARGGSLVARVDREGFWRILLGARAPLMSYAGTLPLRFVGWSG